MKKVNDIPDFLSNIHNEKPAAPLLNSIQSLASEENFMKKLLEASLALQDSEMGGDGGRDSDGESDAVIRDNSDDRFPPVILVTGETLLTAPPPPPPSPAAQFFPSKAVDDLQFLPISNPEISSKTKAIFPQNQKEDDEIVFITQKPQVNELNNLGVHHIQSPALAQHQQAHTVRSQLVVGDQISQTPERQKAEKELEQLEELGKT